MICNHKGFNHTYNTKWSSITLEHIYRSYLTNLYFVAVLPDDNKLSPWPEKSCLLNHLNLITLNENIKT